MPIRAPHLVILASGAMAFSASAQLRVATWNISNYTGVDRREDLQRAIYGTYLGRRFAPDVLCVQEVASAGALAELLDLLNTAPGFPAGQPGSPGDWAAATFIDGPDDESVLLYRTSRVALLRDTLIIAPADPGSDGQPRNTYRWDVAPVGYLPIPINTIGIYGVHLKAGDQSSDNARRLVETTRIRDNARGIDTNGPASALTPGTQYLVLGDFNVQSAGQSAYQRLVGGLGGLAGRFYDPINQPGAWNNNAAFAVLHTQDPTGNGGMDDRHDQILLGPDLLDALGLDYAGQLRAPQDPFPFNLASWSDTRHSYRVWGNDGGTYNQPMAIAGNQMVGASIAQAIANACTPVGGHLPVYLDLRVPGRIVATETIDFGVVPQGSPLPQRTLSVSNVGDTDLWTPAGIADLVYVLTAGAGFGAPPGTFVEPVTPGNNTHTITMSTDVAGPRAGTITITSSDPESPVLLVTLTGHVTPGNQPPEANAGPDFDIIDTDSDGVETVTLDGSLSTDADNAIVDYRWLRNNAVLAAGPTPFASVSLALGEHLITLRVRDASGLVDTDDVLIRVLPACDPDVNCDGSADQGDLACLVLGIAGDPACLCQDPDFNRDGSADQGDIAALIAVIAGQACP